MPSKLTRSKIVKKLDAIFSQYIRLKDADHNGNVTCFTCGKVEHYKKGMQCGHFQSRKHYATRWLELNVAVQCAGCNVFRYGEQFLFSKNLDKKYGKGTAEKLYIKSKDTVKFSNDELLNMIEHYKNLVDSHLID
tara:strand:+ start:414 stop:818 length:405 start_codon:yes stop_codon:yes gene_type:complete